MSSLPSALCFTALEHAPGRFHCSAALGTLTVSLEVTRADDWTFRAEGFGRFDSLSAAILAALRGFDSVRGFQLTIRESVDPLDPGAIVSSRWIEGGAS